MKFNLFFYGILAAAVLTALFTGIAAARGTLNPHPSSIFDAASILAGGSNSARWFGFGNLMPAPEPVATVQPSQQPLSLLKPVAHPVDFFGLDGNLTLQESESLRESGSALWWVDSGAYFFIRNGIGSTAAGALPEHDRWRQLYAASNPLDTDGGYHPQNIFRLIARNSIRNAVQQAYFKIKKYNASPSPNRDGYNGFLFFSRYRDSQNLYYAGLRVDGTAAIKKKINGEYRILDEKPVFPGIFDRNSNPNLIPAGTWIGLKTAVFDEGGGKTNIKVYLDKEANGAWKLVAEAVDDGIAYGPVLGYSASTGIRTDFMDVEFRGYKVTGL